MRVARRLWVLLLLALPACGIEPLPTAQPGTYRIASSLPSKGPLARETLLMRRAIDLAVEEARADGLLLEHIALDGGNAENGESTYDIERRNAQQTSSDPSVLAYIGPSTSRATGWSLPITSKAGLLHIGVTATWPGLTETGWDAGEPGIYYSGAGRNFLRMVPPDSAQARVAAAWVNQEGIARASALHDGSTYSIGLAREFIASAAARGVSVERTATSLESLLGSKADSLAGDGRRALFFAASDLGNAQKLAAFYATNGDADTLIIFTDTALDPRLLDLPNTGAIGLYSTYNGSEVVGGSLVAVNFQQAFERKFGETPTLSSARAYSATKIVAAALLRDQTRDWVLSYALTENHPRGASGEFSDEVTGDRADGPISVFEIEPTGFRLIWQQP